MKLEMVPDFSAVLGAVIGIILLVASIGITFHSLDLRAQGKPIAASQPDVASANADGRLITSTSMGPVRLNMTLDELRRRLPTVSIERGSDGDGAALVEVGFGREEFLVLWAGEDDLGRPIDWSRQIITIYTFSAAFHTVEGVRPGSLVSEVARLFGRVQEVTMSEIESRQFITFERQPPWLTFRLDDTGIFPPRARSTKTVRPDAKILAIDISLRPGPHPRVARRGARHIRRLARRRQPAAATPRGSRPSGSSVV